MRRESWGRLFLAPSTPLVWDASWVGIVVDEVIAITDEALGGAGFEHRTVCVLDEADGRRLGDELGAEPTRVAWPGGRTDALHGLARRPDGDNPPREFAVLVAIRRFLRTHRIPLYTWASGAGQRLYARTNRVLRPRH